MIRRLLVSALSSVALLSGVALVGGGGLVGGEAASPAAASVPSESEWRADVREAMSGSRRYVDRRVGHGTKLAINFDIDNSSLSTHYDPGKAIPVVLRFANHARGQGVELLFNTARQRGDGRLVAAKRELTAAGYQAKEVCGRGSGESKSHSKQRCRRHFVAEGYTLIANVGNRSTDFVGGNYERAFRLPNYNNQLT